MRVNCSSTSPKKGFYLVKLRQDARWRWIRGVWRNVISQPFACTRMRRSAGTISLSERLKPAALALRAGEQTLDEVALEREEHDQRHDELQERGRRDDVDVRPEGASCSRMATVSGCVEVSAKTSATSRSFHTHMNWKISSDAIAGIPSGRTTRRNTMSSPAPSIRAASSSSEGIPMKKLRSRKIANGRPKATWNSTTPGIVPNSP